MASLFAKEIMLSTYKCCSWVVREMFVRIRSAKSIHLYICVYEIMRIGLMSHRLVHHIETPHYTEFDLQFFRLDKRLFILVTWYINYQKWFSVTTEYQQIQQDFITGRGYIHGLLLKTSQLPPFVVLLVTWKSCIYRKNFLKPASSESILAAQESGAFCKSVQTHIHELYYNVSAATCCIQ